MHLIEITHNQSKETLRLIKNGRDCIVEIYLLNNEYKIIHVFTNGKSRVSVSHLSFKKVPSEILQYLIEDFLETFESNVYMFTNGDSPIVHIHQQVLNENFHEEENAHDYKTRWI